MIQPATKEDGHTHGAHDHAAGASSRSLAIALALTALFLIAELAGAWLFNSLALLSDAAHMFTDTAALALALVAVRIGRKPADARRTYGYRRVEILAAAFNALLLLAIAAYVLVAGARRLFAPEDVGSIGMLAVAAVGLAVNLVAMRVLARGTRDSLNVKGAYLEVWADMLGSLGVIGAAGLIWLTGWRWVDPLVAIAIGLWVVPRTWILLRDAANILLQGVPRSVDLDTVRAQILVCGGVVAVHELHLWSVAGNDMNFTAHIVTATPDGHGRVRREVAETLQEQFGITHATLQLETTGRACKTPAHP